MRLFRSVPCTSLLLFTSISAVAVTPSQREMVLKEGDSITVSPLLNKQVVYPNGGDLPFSGPLEIRAGSGFRRYYTWDGATRYVDLNPRGTRWDGSFGAYYPGPGSHWQPNHGITRGVLEEGQKHFESQAEAQRWLDSRPYAVFTSDGLVVEFSQNSAGGGTLSVDLWQILIRKKRPSMLTGSHNELITRRTKTP